MTTAHDPTDPLAGYDDFGIDLSGATAARRADTRRQTLRPDDSDPLPADLLEADRYQPEPR